MIWKGIDQENNFLKNSVKEFKKVQGSQKKDDEKKYKPPEATNSLYYLNHLKTNNSMRYILAKAGWMFRDHQENNRFELWWVKKIALYFRD